jgi:hypothetical protein
MQSKDFSFIADRLELCMREMYVKINGGVYIDPVTEDSFVYDGISVTNKVQTVLDMSSDKTKSYVALRDAEHIMNYVQDIRLSAQMLRIELKTLLSEEALIASSALHKKIKSMYSRCCDYLDLCDKQYDFMTEILFGVSQVNVSINRRYFNGDEVMYMYKDDGHD